VDFYLPYFRQQLITCALSAILPFQPLFTESSCGDELLVPHPFSSVLPATVCFCCVLVFSSLFIVQFFFFFAGRRQSTKGAMTVCPRGGWGNTT
jgi:hypothetical protein